ncbi:hypothetical protein B0H13DRAFT_2021478 [Mycena leptocephala]|nr:hypothetical protein B0H13DRAFT_2021478 [Mycena leptocephala]
METPRGRGRPKGSKNKKNKKPRPIYTGRPRVSARPIVDMNNSIQGSSELEFRPYLPPPERIGITCAASYFLVEKVPENYPFSCATTSFGKFRFPFFCFSGPDPPPADIGSLGDVYVAPAANALYAYLPSDGLFEDGAWTRWSAVCPESDNRWFKPGETGLLQHPFIPERILWVSEGVIWWYTLGSVNTIRAKTRARKLFPENEDVAAVTKIIVAHTLQIQNGDYKVLSESSARKRRLDEENEASKEARKKLRSHQDASHSQHLNRPNTATHRQQQPTTIDDLEGSATVNTSLHEQLRKQAAIISGLEEDKAALKMSLDNERRGGYQARGGRKHGAAKGAQQAGSDHCRLGEGERGPEIVTG